MSDATNDTGVGKIAGKPVGFGVPILALIFALSGIFFACVTFGAYDEGQRLFKDGIDTQAKVASVSDYIIRESYRGSVTETVDVEVEIAGNSYTIKVTPADARKLSVDEMLKARYLKANPNLHYVSLDGTSYKPPDFFSFTYIIGYSFSLFFLCTSGYITWRLVNYNEDGTQRTRLQ